MRPRQKKKPGIYLIGQHIVLDKQNKYLIKVGRGDDVDDRLKRYLTYNPIVECFEIKYLTAQKAREEENIYQQILSKKWELAPKTKEWFLVSAQFYNKCKKEGFKAIMGDTKKVVTIENKSVLKVKDIINYLDKSAAINCPWLRKDIKTKRTHVYDAIMRSKSDPVITKIATAAYDRRGDSRGNYTYYPQEVFTLLTTTSFRPSGWVKDNDSEFVLESGAIELNSDVIKPAAQVTKKFIGTKASVIQDLENFKILMNARERLKEELDSIETDLNTYPDYFVTYVGELK